MCRSKKILRICKILIKNFILEAVIKVVNYVDTLVVLAI